MSDGPRDMLFSRDTEGDLIYDRESLQTELEQQIFDFAIVSMMNAIREGRHFSGNAERESLMIAIGKLGVPQETLRYYIADEEDEEVVNLRARLYVRTKEVGRDG